MTRAGLEDQAMPRIAVVGPLLPYRGGIAQYNTLLARAFADQGDDALFVSFSRQYPRWLYPGKGDIDSLYAGHRERGALYLIDSVNPLSWWKAARAIARQGVQLAVFHWWTVFWAPCFGAMIWLLRRRGVRVALICHNLVDHEASGLKAAVSRYVIGMADAYLVHSREHAETLRREQPGKPVESHPIPAYGHYPQPHGKLAKRGRLELLFFGFIRPYKGLDVLLEAMRIADDRDVHLTVIGEHWGDSSALVRQYAGHSNIELRLEYVDDAEAAEYFARADFVVLPYRSATPSAVVALAYHYDVPVIASRVAGLDDVVMDELTGVLVPPSDPDALACTIGSVTRERARELAVGVGEYKHTHGWDAICARVRMLASAH